MRDLRASQDWRIVDGVILAVTGAIPILVRFKLISYEASPHFYFLPLIVFFRLLLFHVYHLYDFEYHNGYFDVVYTTAGVMGFSMVAELFLVSGSELYFLRQPTESPLYEYAFFMSYRIPIYSAFFGFLLCAGWRCAFIYYAYHIKKLKTRVLIVGAGEVGQTLGEDIKTHASLVYEVVGYVDDEEYAGKEDILGTPEDLEKLIQEHNVDEVLVAWHRRRLVEILDECTRLDVRVRLLPAFNEVILGQLHILQIAGMPLVSTNAFSHRAWQSNLKRAFDLAFSGVALILLSPVMALVALAVRLTSRGPVFYRQVRVGRGGEHFKVNKFRTMVQNAEKDGAPVLATQNDPRVTPIGRFLRRTALDELPQFWNVFAGQMSLVGPRPERPKFVAEFSEEFPEYPLRHIVRPGMTGLAQIYGRYDLAAEHKLRYDLAYINSGTFFLDLRIILKTIRKTLTGSRAR
jgi:exopolysaccharide biosynthesis polyprenyl glycosylphosphotransferase